MARRDAPVVNERAQALALLRRIERESLFASLVLAGESGFVRTLVLGVLRWRSRLDFVIDTLAKRSIEPEILDVLRLGAYQLLYMDVARYAAVAETVELAPKRARGFVNAILRRITRGDVPEPRDLATRTAHPAWLIERWTRAYGAERAAKIAAANQEMSYPDVLALTNEVPPESEPSTLADHIYKLRGSTANLDRAKFWPMDEGSAVIAAIAANLGGEVLDLAAAPGGKTLYMRRAGARVISNDISITRLLPLARRDAKIVVSDARKPAFNRGFDVVLLDAPCSATGTIRKSPEIKWRLRESDLPAFAARQRELIAAALSLTKKYVVYSTCSLEHEENDDIVASTGARVVPIDRTWTENGVLRLTPESGADGFTVHVLTR
jgi:16S rRNA (cytosine967-C5)-methyltransferase